MSVKAGFTAEDVLGNNKKLRETETETEVKTVSCPMSEA